MNRPTHLRCPVCADSEMEQGFLWTDEGGALSWAGGEDPPPTRFLVGRKIDATVYLSDPDPNRAYWCRQCNSFVLFKMDVEVEDRPPDTPEADDTSETAECLSCGEAIPAGASRCPRCGWSYLTDDPDQSGTS